MLLAANVTHDKVPTLRHMMVSSAPLPPDVARASRRARGSGFLSWTGACPSTPTSRAACRRRRPKKPTSASCSALGGAVDWAGVAGRRARVVDASGAPAPAGMRGELVVRGHSTMLGYLNDPEATSRTIDAEGWLRTGDEGFFEEDDGRSTFFVTGRLKEVIIRDAEKYSPLRIERALVAAMPELSGKIVVLGFAHGEHGEEVGAYVETDAFDDGFAQKLSAAVQGVPVPERPKVVLYGTTPIARTHTGKVQRRKMQGWFAPWAAHKGRLVFAPLSS